MLDELSLPVPEASLGAIYVTDLSFEYRARGDAAFGRLRCWWKATGSVSPRSSAGDAGSRLALDPPPNGIAFCDGALRGAGGELVRAWDGTATQPAFASSSRIAARTEGS